MKFSPIKFLLAFTVICAFSAVSFAQDSENVYPSDRKLKIIEMPLPRIPDEIRSMSIQGNIVVRVTFLSNNEIGDVQPIRDFPYITEVVVEAAKKIIFEPEIKNGIATTITKTVQYTFDWGNGWQNALNKSAKILKKPDEEISNDTSEKDTESCLVFLYVELLDTKKIGKIEPYENYCKDKNFEKRAIELARKIEFEPALREGKAVTSFDLINFSFQRIRQISDDSDDDDY